MRWLPLAMLLLVVGCKSDRIFGSSTELSLGVQRVQFPKTWVGHPTRAQLEIRSGSRASRSVTLATQAPFAVEAGPLQLAGGSTLYVEVIFAPEVVGAAEREVVIDSDGVTLKAILSGVAEAVPECPARACWTAAFDTDTGACVETKQSDGAACSVGSCLLDAHCADGLCVGEAKDCDDHDACNTDSCEPVSGCVHFAATARCGASSDPCKVPICEPATGCGFVDAADGTTCGPSDCVTANICLLGKCKQVAVTDGAACGASSPCQPRGLCDQQTCVRPAAKELVTLWTQWLPTGHHLAWDSIADALGNVYWRDYDPDYGAAHLVSVTGNGFPRYSVAIPAAAQLALIEDVLLLRSGPKLEAHRASDGSLKWSRTLTLDPGATGSLSIINLSRGTPGSVYVAIVRMDSAEAPAATDSSIASLNISNGTTNWEAHFPLEQLRGDSMPVDEGGYVYVGSMNKDRHSRYLSVSPLGQVRWDVDNFHADPAAVFGGRVYHWDHWLSETATGAWVNTAAPVLQVAGFPRLALGAISYVGSTQDQVPSCAMPGAVETGTVLTLVRVDPATSTERWSLEIAGASSGSTAMTNTVLTSRNTILFSQGSAYCGKRHVLREISELGQNGFSCELPGEEVYFGEGLLDDGRWVAAVKDPVTGAEGVRAIYLPGFQLPEHGWASAWGSPARDNHAR